MVKANNSLTLTDKIFLQQCEFKLGVTHPDSLPSTDTAEVAFIGRSNVGKSSLINALLNRRIARTSQKPGHTRQLNFFLLAEKFYIVDMPGYGYAAAAKVEIARWRKLIYCYLQGRRQLRKLFVLVDARHGIKPSDIDMLNIIAEHPVTTQIVLTKIDKISAKQVEEISIQVGAAMKPFPMCHPEIITVSSTKLQGISALRAAIIEATQAA